MRLFKFHNKFETKVPFIYPYNIQINASEEEINQRMQKFIERKREEINQSNIRDFCSQGNTNCARIDAKLVKRKDSKGHLQVNRVYNTYQRDQDDFEFLKNYMPKSGIEERLKNLEVRLGFDFPVNRNIYEKLKNLEERLLHLETVSPEYVQLWEKNLSFQKPSAKKRVYTLNEIDSFISHLETKKEKVSESTEGGPENTSLNRYI